MSLALSSSSFAPPQRSACGVRIAADLGPPQLAFPTSVKQREVGAGLSLAAACTFKNSDYAAAASAKRWRTNISFFPSFLKSKGKGKNSEKLKEELLKAIAPLDRGADASPEDKERIDQIASELEAVNTIKEPLKSDLLNGKWELLYTTSSSILQVQRPKFLRPSGKIYQSINADTLRAQNMETWPYFNQVTANLMPLSSKRVAVMFDTFKIFGLISIKAPGRARGELEITYLDEEIRISRGDKGNLFILKMVDPSYRVPV